MRPFDADSAIFFLDGLMVWDAIYVKDEADRGMGCE